MADVAALRVEYEHDDHRTSPVVRITRDMIEAETDPALLAIWEASLADLGADVRAHLEAYAASGMSDEAWAARARSAMAFAQMGARRCGQRRRILGGEGDLDKLRAAVTSLKAALVKSKLDAAHGQAARDVLPDTMLALVTKRAAEILEEKIGEIAP